MKKETEAHWETITMTALDFCSWGLRVESSHPSASRVLGLAGRKVSFSVPFLDLIPSIVDFDFSEVS